MLALASRVIIYIANKHVAGRLGGGGAWVGFSASVDRQGRLGFSRSLALAFVWRKHKPNITGIRRDTPTPIPVRHFEAYDD